MLKLRTAFCKALDELPECVGGYDPRIHTSLHHIQALVQFHLDHFPDSGHEECLEWMRRWATIAEFLEAEVASKPRRAESFQESSSVIPDLSGVRLQWQPAEHSAPMEE